MTLAGFAIPPLPAARARALPLMLGQDVAIAELAVAVESDPALVTALLRAANSAASSPRERVDSAGAALVRLGLEPARQIAMGVLLSEGFPDLDGSLYDLDELWRHLLVVALVADTLAGLDTPPGASRPAAFTAGLLHDTGRLAMLAMEPGACAAVIELVGNGLSPLEAELELLGEDHAAWGGRIAREWGLPEPIPQAIAGHHGAAIDDPLAEILVRARHIARDLGVGDGCWSRGRRPPSWTPSAAPPSRTSAAPRGSSRGSSGSAGASASAPDPCSLAPPPRASRTASLRRRRDTVVEQLREAREQSLVELPRRGGERGEPRGGRHARATEPVDGDRRVGIGDGDAARLDRDRVADEARGVAAAVPALVVLEDRALHCRRGEPRAGEQPLRELRVAAHQLMLAGRLRLAAQERGREQRDPRVREEPPPSVIASSSSPSTTPVAPASAAAKSAVSTAFVTGV